MDALSVELHKKMERLHYVIVNEHGVLIVRQKKARQCITFHHFILKEMFALYMNFFEFPSIDFYTDVVNDIIVNVLEMELDDVKVAVNKLHLECLKKYPEKFI